MKHVVIDIYKQNSSGPGTVNMHFGVVESRIDPCVSSWSQQNVESKTVRSNFIWQDPKCMFTLSILNSAL